MIFSCQADTASSVVRFRTTETSGDFPFAPVVNCFKVERLKGGTRTEL